jgi:HEPN domain-containing protein
MDESAKGDYALELIVMARRDLTAWQLLVDQRLVHDSVLGFHAQQAIEKCLKAVLARARVPVRRTHSLATLLDHLQQSGISSPPFATRLESLSPFAVDARYGLDLEAPLDRTEVALMLEAVLSWALAGTARP